MDNLMLEVSSGAIVAGGVLVMYIKKIKNRLHKTILRDYTHHLETTIR